MNLAAKALKHRDRFEHEIAVLLREHDLDSEGPDVLETLRRWGTLNDRRVAEQVRDKGIAKFSPLESIRQSLASRGADSAIIEEVLGELPRDHDLTSARALLEKKFKGPVPGPKVARFLASRGFSEDVILTILEDVSA